METPSLDDLMALNDQLAALVAAGVPLDIGLGEPGEDVTATLEKINAALARRVSRGASLAEALEADDPAVPAAYRHMVQLGLRLGKLDAGLEGSQRLAESVEKTKYGVRAAFFYPLIVCCLAFAGLIAFCRFFVPALNNMHDGLAITRGTGLQVLQSLRDTLPYWAAIPPVAVLLLIIVWQTRARSRRETPGSSPSFIRWLPGMSRAAFQERCASFAEALSALLSAETPLPEGLRLASGACDEKSLSDAGRALATALEQGHAPDDDSPTAQPFPPFLRWALLHSEPTTSRAAALQMAAKIYRQAAERRAERVRLVTPIVASVVLGGGATLLYGLALFVPVVEMLQALGILIAANMPVFRYQALNAAQQLVAGEVDADGVGQAISQLEARGLTVQSIGYASSEAAPRESAVPAKKIEPRKTAHPAPSLEWTVVHSHMTKVFARGKLLVPALRAYADEMPSSRRRRELRTVCELLDQGDAAAATTALVKLPEYWIPLLSSATSANDPGRVLCEFLDESESADALRRQWWLTLAYPKIVLLIAAVVLVALSMLVVPVFRDIFADFQMELPVLTRIVLAVSQSIVSGWAILWLLALFVVAFLVLNADRLSSLWAWPGDAWGALFGRSTAIAQFSRFTADLLGAGINLPDALRIAAFTTKRSRLRRASWRLADEIETGREHAQPAKRGALTATFCYALQGDMPTASRIHLLKELSSCHAERARGRLSWTRGVIEPITICVVGALVGVVVLALMLPLVKLLNALSG